MPSDDRTLDADDRCSVADLLGLVTLVAVLFAFVRCCFTYGVAWKSYELVGLGVYLVLGMPLVLGYSVAYVVGGKRLADTVGNVIMGLTFLATVVLSMLVVA